MEVAALRGVAVDRDEEVGLLAVGRLRAPTERDEGVVVARHPHVEPALPPEQGGQLVGDLEVDRLLVHPLRPDRPRVLSAVA